MKASIYRLAIWVFLANTVQAQYQPIPLDPAQLRQDFQILKTNLEEFHPCLYTYTNKSQFDAVFQQIEAKLEAPMTALEFFRLLMPLHLAIRNNHTKIYPPNDYVEAATTTLPRLPIRLYWYQDSLFVTEDLSRENQIGVGSQITSINGEDALDVFQFLANQLSTDGFNRSYPYTLAGLGFSRYYAYFKGTPDEFLIEYKTAEGIPKKARIAGIPVPEIMATRKIRVKDSPRKDELDFRVQNKIGILRLSTFQIDPSSNITPRAYKTLLKSAFSELKSANIKTLILDLRGNGGGFPEAAYHLLSYLISEPVYPSKGEYALVGGISPPHHYEEDMFFKHFNRQPLKWDGEYYQVKGAARTKVKPKPLTYKGKLLVLINSRCASATTELLGQIASHCSATFIGEETGGNPATQVASDLLSLVLPNADLKVQLPVIRSVMNVTFENKGQGLMPDVLFRPRVEDILSGEDTLLKFALRQAQSPDD
ncbi:MAG: hypothetical protein KTR30_35980 [Saprospiraceae bacterium]|nr:hypothetical protein [Saprospiraceae bacterium]